MLKRIQRRLNDFNHPLPKSMDVYPGGIGTLDRALVGALLEYTSAEIAFRVCTHPGALGDGAQVTSPEKILLQVEEDGEEGDGEDEHQEAEEGDDEDEQQEDDEHVLTRPGAPQAELADGTRIVGTMPLCRFLGRIYRLTPTDPRDSALIDTTLDDLSLLLVAGAAEESGESPHSVLVRPGAHGTHAAHLALLDQLSAYLAEGTAHLNGMDSESLADVLWKAAVQWLIAQGYLNEDDVLARANVHLWLRAS